MEVLVLNNNISGYYAEYMSRGGIRDKKEIRTKMEINDTCPPHKLKNVISGELLS